MAASTLGNRRYSSWSMRGWLAVRLARLDVEEVVIPLSGGGDTGAVRQVSPSGLVPYLEHNGHRVWETLAICEYCAELSPAIWPADLAARTHARVIAAEMHAGFRDLRMAMPMNLGRVFAGLGRSEGALADIARIETLWARNAATVRQTAGLSCSEGRSTARTRCSRPWSPDFSPTSPS